MLFCVLLSLSGTHIDTNRARAIDGGSVNRVKIRVCNQIFIFVLKIVLLDIPKNNLVENLAYQITFN
jgi:hypothetical protein